MEELCDKIKKYKQGDIKALEEILIQMTPLVKNISWNMRTLYIRCGMGIKMVANCRKGL